MRTEQTFEQLSRAYQEARVAHMQGFRAYLIERGITITSSEHLAAEQINYDITHNEEVSALEALGVEFAAAQARQQERALAANELAAQAHDTNARWARQMDDRMARGAD